MTYRKDNMEELMRETPKDMQIWKARQLCDRMEMDQRLIEFRELWMMQAMERLLQRIEDLERKMKE